MGLKRTGADLLAPLRPLLNGRSGMQPGYLVVGTKRGGSTSAYHWIAKHPQVAPCRTRKGTHYFDVNFSRGEQWFRSGFVRSRPPWRITGEASPYYMFHPLAPQRIAATLPEVRLIMVLREPCARAWSHHQYELGRGADDQPFETALDLEAARLEGEEERLKADPSYESFAHRHHSYLTRGHYADQISRLLQLFPRDQLLVLQSEALFADPTGQLNRVWDFLDLDRVHLDGLEALKAGNGGAMPPHVRARLESHYAEHNERLYRLPGIDFRWPSQLGTTS